MSRETVLLWRHRHRCQGCGARSRGRALAGDMTATTSGWLCPACLAKSETDISPAREFEPAPAGATISPRGAAGTPAAAA